MLARVENAFTSNAYLLYRENLKNAKYDLQVKQFSAEEINALKQKLLAEIPQDLPSQLYAYECGAVKYTFKDYQAALSDFKKAYAKNSDAKKLASAFMIMRTQQKINPTGDEFLNAHKELQKCIGLPDKENLIFEADGYLAMWYLDKADYVSALQLYLDRLICIAKNKQDSDEYFQTLHIAETSLRQALKRAIADNLSSLIGNQNFEDLVCDELTSGWSKTDLSKLATWVDLLKKNNSSFKKFGGSIALKFYNGGEFEKAKEVLALSNQDEPLVRWVKSKFLIMQGDEKSACEIIKDLMKNYSESGLARFENGGLASGGFLPNRYLPNSNKGALQSPRHAFFINGEDIIFNSPLRSKLISEYGVLQFNLGDLTAALDCFLNAKYFMDAAFICEIMLDLPSLKKYATLRLADKSKEADFVRAILTLRILQEEKDFTEASKFFTGNKKYIATMCALQTALKIANDETASRRIRSIANWEIFTIYCEGAAEIFASFFNPNDINFNNEMEIIEERFNAFCSAQTNFNWGDSNFSDEFKNADTKTNNRIKEFNKQYRSQRSHLHIAFDYALKAADLMDDENLAVRMYVASICKLRYRDPNYINNAFINLVKRCPNTELAKEAKKINWLPMCQEKPRDILNELKK